MRVAFAIGNTIRDLAGITLVAMRLCRTGATCYLVPSDMLPEELSALAPDFVMMDHMRRHQEDLTQKLLEAGVKVGVLDDEGGVFTSLNWYGDALADDPSIRYRVACYCCWGPKFADHLLKNKLYQPVQVTVTGAPRFDFYALPWKGIMLPGTPSGQDYPNPVVLINGNFSQANPVSGSPEKKVRSISKIRNYDIEFAREFQAKLRQTMLGIVDMTNHLTKNFPEVTFIYRPHPFERLETYEELLVARDNLKITKQGNIVGWLALADAVIQHGCTTALEAGMVGLPALSPHWLHSPKAIAIVDAVSIRCATQEIMDAKIKKLLAGTLERPQDVVQALDEVIGNWFYAIDGKSHERVADLINRSLNSEAPGGVRSTVNMDLCRALYKGIGRTPRKKWYSNIKSLVAKSPQQLVAKDDRRATQFSADDVRKIVNGIAACEDGIGGNYLVEKAAGDDYVVAGRSGTSVSLRLGQPPVSKQ